MIEKKRLATAIGLAISANTLVVHAQQEPQPVLELVFVTGTRIEQPDFVFSNPVMSVDAESALASGQTNLTTFLTEFPALTGSYDSFDSGGSNAFIGGAGLNLLNLRNLGFDRTLVLVDGRRHVGTLSESTAVDISTIPIDLIDRVDILTGGASAIYGSDGVTGVVNFVMKHDFEGFTIRAQGNEPGDPGANKQFAGVTYGKNFGDNDRGNVTVAAEFTSEKRLLGFDRDFNGARPGILTRFHRNPADTADPPVGDGDLDDPAIPDRIPVERSGFGDTSRCGAVFVTFANYPSPDYNCDGSAWDFGDLPPQTVGGFPDFPILPYYQIGGDATLQDDYVGNSTVLPDIDRTAVNVFVNYEIGRRAEFFSEIKYVESDIFNLSQPSFDFFLFFEPDNPFIPAALQADAAAEGGLYMSRDNFDLGVRGDDINRETVRSVVGFKGDLDWADYEVSLVYGKSKVTADQLNNRFEDRFFAALDVIDNGGVPDCRVNVDPAATPFDFPDAITYSPAAGNCVPLNLFGEGVASPAAVDWVMNTTTAVDEIEQKVLSGFLRGDWVDLPGGALGWVVGAEYREESSESRPDPFDTAGATFGNIIDPNFGEFDVTEIFAETNLPVLAGKPGAQELTFELAFRASDYSSIGSTNTWKAGSIWAPVDTVAFRATVAQAVRAPNIGESFSADGQDFEFIDDPCSVTELPNGTQFRAANCSALLTPLGIDPGSFVDPNSASIGGVSGGNPNVREETADTTTYGVIFTPSFIDNFTLAIDYYAIDLKDAIQSISAQELANRCVDAPTLNNEFCPLIGRDPLTGAIDFFRQAPVNIARLETEGYDISLNYLFDPNGSGGRDPGIFNFRLIANKLEKLDFLPSPGGVVDDDVGEGPAVSFAGQRVPEWQASFDLTWDRGPWTINYGFQWFDKTQRISNRDLFGDADQPGGNRDRISSQWYYYDRKLSHDVHLRFRTPNDFSIYGGINNFTDEKTAIDSVSHPVSPVGRTYYLGFTGEIGG